MQSHYDILGLTNKATPEEIQKAYDALSTLDKSELKQDFTLIQAAYQTLIDPDKRAAYDLSLVEGNYIQKFIQYYKSYRVPNENEVKEEEVKKQMLDPEQLKRLGNQILWVVAGSGNVEFLRWLVKKTEIDPNYRFHNERTPLMNASSAPMVDLLIELKANVNQRDIYGVTPLEHQLDLSSTEEALRLLEHGANPNKYLFDQAKRGPRSPLDIVVDNIGNQYEIDKNYEMIKTLILFGANPERRLRYNGQVYQARSLIERVNDENEKKQIERCVTEAVQKREVAAYKTPAELKKYFPSDIGEVIFGLGNFTLFTMEKQKSNPVKATFGVPETLEEYMPTEVSGIIYHLASNKMFSESSETQDYTEEQKNIAKNLLVNLGINPDDIENLKDSKDEPVNLNIDLVEFAKLVANEWKESSNGVLSQEMEKALQELQTKEPAKSKFNKP